MLNLIGRNKELLIEDINKHKVELKQNKLKVETLGHGLVWLDTGTQDALAEATEFVPAIEKRQRLKTSCIEEIAWKRGYINTNEIK